MGKKGAQPLKQFVAVLKKKYAPSLILLFGSRARNEHLKESDYDLIVVSERFRGSRWVRRHEEAYMCWGGNERLDLLCYSPDEFEAKKRQIGIVKTAVEEGTVLWSA